MDRRLIMELVPGVAFLLGNASGGLFWAAGAAMTATGAAVALRWKWDGRAPLMAVSILGITLTLTFFGVVLDDTTFVLIRPTVGAVAFAVIIGLGVLAEPSLLKRTLGYRLRIEDRGWRILHIVWAALALLTAVANEVARRVLTTEQWAFFNAISDPALIALIYLGTRLVTRWYWVLSEDKNDHDQAPLLLGPRGS
jgi:intracellular septation protein